MRRPYLLYMMAEAYARKRDRDTARIWYERALAASSGLDADTAIVRPLARLGRRRTRPRADLPARRHGGGRAHRPADEAAPPIPRQGARSGRCRSASASSPVGWPASSSDRALAHYFGLGPHQDVFRAALRGPNLLQEPVLGRASALGVVHPDLLPSLEGG